MHETDIYELFDEIDKLTKGALKKEYALSKVYHMIRSSQEITSYGQLCFAKKRKNKPNEILIVGNPIEVNSYLIPFFRGLKFGMDYSIQIFTKGPKSPKSRMMKQLLYNCHPNIGKVK